jgi:flagellar export protein FliJ
MTKTLSTLIKVHQHAVDEQRRAVAKLEGLRERMIEALATLRAEMQAEKLVAATDYEAGARWPDYIQYALKKESDFEKQILVLERQIAEARDELQNRFSELKKYELAKQAYDAEQAAEQARQERNEMDEIAGQRDARSE